MNAHLEYQIKRDRGAATFVMHGLPSEEGIADMTIHWFAPAQDGACEGGWHEQRDFHPFYRRLQEFPRVQIIWRVPEPAPAEEVRP